MMMLVDSKFVDYDDAYAVELFEAMANDVYVLKGWWWWRLMMMLSAAVEQVIYERIEIVS